MATIAKRGNSYKITVSLGYDLNGKQIRKTMTWKPESGMTARQIEKEINRQATLFEEKCRKGQILDDRIKFSDFVEIWQKDYADKQLRDKTNQRNKQALERILVALGHLQIGKIQPHHLNEFYNNLAESGIRRDTKYKCIIDLKEIIKAKGYTVAYISQLSNVALSTFSSIFKGKNTTKKCAEQICSTLEYDLRELFEPVDFEKPLSNNTILCYHRIISSILGEAVKQGILLSNPCSRVRTPKIKHKEAEYLEENDVIRLLQSLEKEPLQYRALITLLLYSGMRRGEALGLTWKDINFKDNLIDINKSSLYVSGKGIFDDETKNESSKRVIKVPQSVIDSLKQLQIEQFHKRQMLTDEDWQDCDKVFKASNGSPLHPDTLSSWFKRFLKRHNLPNCHIHTLRHTNASLLIAQGINVRTVSNRLGHAQTSTTENIYSHAIKTADEKAAETLEEILTQKKA
ncbi:tyrosine-type recombinase/integrase [Candidatus Pseudoruminococcus sp.]|uniref:tyrosine-type recombinase/integrase n=1 Tax=Candidatus Pseudoruminococcus sp. TaxID=3101048 RepID=UPI00399977FB